MIAKYFPAIRERIGYEFMMPCFISFISTVFPNFYCCRHIINAILVVDVYKTSKLFL